MAYRSNHPNRAMPQCLSPAMNYANQLSKAPFLDKSPSGWGHRLHDRHPRMNMFPNWANWRLRDKRIEEIPLVPTINNKTNSTSIASFSILSHAFVALFPNLTGKPDALHKINVKWNIVQDQRVTNIPLVLDNERFYCQQTEQQKGATTKWVREKTKKDARTCWITA